MSSEVGEILENVKEFRGQWRIPNFQFLQGKVDKIYKSPKFFFWDSCWCLAIHPSGTAENPAYVGLYLRRVDHGLPKRLYFGIDIETPTRNQKREVFEFSTTPQLLGWPRCFQTTRLEQEDNFDLTIKYSLESSGNYISAFSGSLLNRLWKVNRVLEDIVCKGNNSTDVKLKLQDGELGAHKVILKARSPVFNRMFEAGMLESETGEVTIGDATVEAFRVAISFANSGDPRGLDAKNVMEVYRVAHKYEFDDLTRFCIVFMKETITTDTVFDVIVFADKFEEEELKDCAINYFHAKKSEILEGDKWKAFKTENVEMAFELLERFLKR